MGVQGGQDLFQAFAQRSGGLPVDRLHDLLVSLRVHGQAVKSDLEGRTFDHDPKYLNMRIGMNARMDTIQAAASLVNL